MTLATVVDFGRCEEAGCDNAGGEGFARGMSLTSADLSATVTLRGERFS